jgi:hypothetical protein
MARIVVEVEQETLAMLRTLEAATSVRAARLVGRGAELVRREVEQVGTKEYWSWLKACRIFKSMPRGTL